MVGAKAKEKSRRRSSEVGGITAQAVDQLWGASKATGAGRLGMTARLSQRRAKGRTEISRPACKYTHAISVWMDGSTHSAIRLDGKTRFSQIRGPGTLQIARAGESVDVVMNDRNGRCLDFYLPDSLLKGALERDFDRSSSGLELLEVGVVRDAEIIRLARAVLVELETPTFLARVAIDAATLALCVALIRRWSNQASVILSPTPNLAPWKVRRVSDLMKQSLTENLTLTELAASVELSPYHFLRAFKASVGASPHSYQIQLRLDRARDLLETTRLSVREIAAQVGYEDPGYLARLFRKHLGTTPASYRRERKS
jgi:AraC family transcriptional regulator